VSGLGEAALDRALADTAWVEQRLAEARSGKSLRAKDWGKEALVRADLEVRWLVCADRATARAVEEECLRLLGRGGLWNRRLG